MSTLLVWREQLQEFYTKYSFYITRAARFVLGMLVFGLINFNIGFMKAAASVFVTVGLAVVCTFLPPVVMAAAATLLVLLHFAKLSLGVALVAAIVFLLMYIFYLRFSYNQIWVILVTAAAFALKIPLVIPVMAGLLGGIGSLAPVICGTAAYYMIHAVKNSSGLFKGEGMSGITDELIAAAKLVFTNQEMWLMLMAVVICILIVWIIRTRSVDHAWKIASGTGAAVGLIVGIAGNIVLNVHISIVMLLVSAVLAVAFGLLAEVFFLSVDYSRTEYVEFEDDEYHYFVKAVPKVGVAVPEKHVKHITRHQGRQSEREHHPNGGRTAEKSVEEAVTEMSTDEILLTRSLSKELGIDEKDIEELTK